MSVSDLYDVIVIGGGAAGLMAAITASEQSSQVLILDHHKISGKKILATGNGKCNFTNQMQGTHFYRCDDPAFVTYTLSEFSASDCVEFFQNQGVMSYERNGYYYPRSNQASTIRNALIEACFSKGVTIRNHTKISSIAKENSQFVISSGEKNYKSKSVILACGGMASPKTGSDGSGYDLAKEFGHSITKPLPALTPLVSDAGWLGITNGVRCNAKITLAVDKEVVCSDEGEIQFTGYGISGIPVFQVSRYAVRALDTNSQVNAFLDLMPELTKEEFTKFLYELVERLGAHKSWMMILNGFLNDKITEMLCVTCGLGKEYVMTLPEKKWKKQLALIVSKCKELKVNIIGTKDFEQAQVTTGGVRISEINKMTMESNVVKGLYFAGEIIDVDAICGGYNLQWAWASGRLAGKSAAVSIR